VELFRTATLEQERLSRQAISRAWNAIVRANAAGDLESRIVEFVEFHAPRREPVIAQRPIWLAPLIEVLSEGSGIRVVRGPYRVRGGPSVSNVPSGMRCGSCGSPYFNRACCVLCGEMSGIRVQSVERG
jgi:hypothetical protein